MTVALVMFVAHSVALAKPDLASWNDGPRKDAIVSFVRDVTRRGSAGFVPPEERVAVFDNDGTLWCEHPTYVQLAFLLEQVKAAAPDHPETTDLDLPALLELAKVAESGMTVAAHEDSMRAWLETARHPRFDRPYTDLVYQPMVELLGYLRDHGFQVYIVTGGGIEFVRVWAEEVYGVPPEHVVGTVSEVTYEVRDGEPTLVRGSKLDFVDDGPGKPVGIYRAIGRRPIAAFGNSDGDRHMLEFTAGGDGSRLSLLVHHDDAEREYAYDRAAGVGQLDVALDQAARDGWVVVSMKDDWSRIFPFEEPR